MSTNLNTLAPVQVILYSKPNCSLCDALLDDLAWLQRELAFTVVSHDISDDPTLADKFQYLVPVLKIGGTFYNPPHDLLQTRQRIITAARDGAKS
jgi:thiol-disulfide isomerase/thioredoxin